MISFKALAKYGTTNERLKEIFTTVAPRQEDEAVIGKDEYQRRHKDWLRRELLEQEIMDRLGEAILHSVKNYTLYSAADLAWDSNPINKTTIPLVLYAQGKVSMVECAKSLQGLKNSDQYVKKDAKGLVTEINLPKFFEVECNLVRSFVTRRLAAQANKYNNLWPYYKYESRSTGMVGKLRADAMSQRADIMADQFGWRHHDNQVYRDMFLYGHSVDFVRQSWECEEQIFPKEASPEFTPSEGEDFEVEPRVVREGVCFVNPHPTRVFYDHAYPLSSINTDTGCTYIGYWDVCRYRDIAHNPLYWNREAISYAPPLWQIFSTFASYFTQYYDSVTPPPGADPQMSREIAADNDRKNNIGIYSGSQLDSAVFKSEYYRKLVPSDYGIGSYPHPVWMRFVVASDRTVIFAEIMPSSPAAYCGLNESESRLYNLSFAHEVMPYQDQMNNLLTSMLLLAQAELVKVFLVNKDVLTEEQRKALQAKFEGRDWASKPIVVEYSLSDTGQLGQEVKKAVELVETKVGQSFEVLLRAMAHLVSLVEKMTAMSPAEQGQPAPREISATEVNEISATTSSVYTFISDSIDFMHSAKKRIVYDSTVARQKSEVKLPVVGRYTMKTVEAAGFKAYKDEDEDYSDPNSKRRTVIGTVNQLVHDYIFTTRDGAERPVNTQAANTLVQLLQGLVPVQGVLQALGKEKLYMLVNEILRMSGAGLDLNLELREGEDDTLGVDAVQQLAQQFEQFTQGVQQLAEQVKTNTQGLAEQEQVNNQQQEALKLLGELAQNVKRIMQEQERDRQQLEKLKDEPPKESLQYQHAPWSVQSQMERAAGYTPASDDDRKRKVEAEKKPAPAKAA